MLNRGQNAQRIEAKMLPDLVSGGHDLRSTVEDRAVKYFWRHKQKLYMRLRGSA
jgi:hypothetical protein